MNTSPEVGVVLRSYQPSAGAHSICWPSQLPGYGWLGVSIRGINVWRTHGAKVRAVAPVQSARISFNPLCCYGLSAAVQSNKVYLARLAMHVFISIASRKINAIR